MECSAKSDSESLVMYSLNTVELPAIITPTANSELSASFGANLKAISSSIF